MDLSLTEINEAVVTKAAAQCREKGVLIPTIAQMKDPSTVPAKMRERLKDVGLWDMDPANLFRITWRNDPESGLFNDGNWVEFPSELTGVDARIVGLVGKYFPTGAHKVGAAFGCLVPRLVTGQFDPTSQKAVWPSTGNFCRGGAFDSALLGCDSVAILPEEMSRERFEWLNEVATEVIATPGCESNVKEIYDKCWEIRRTRPECVIFNQFEEFGNPIWHYHVTGSAVQMVYDQIAQPGQRLAAWISSTGSAGTIAAGDYLKTQHRDMLITAVEALQCPTLYSCGFGGHRIEGIGDKHVPWVHNVRNTDFVSAIDDEQCMSLFRLFNESAGQKQLADAGIKNELIEQLPLLGISSICNVVAAIKTARHYGMDQRDIIFMPLTDSAEMYSSRLGELNEANGAYTAAQAGADQARWLDGVVPDNVRELSHHDRQTLHNFKYFTWVEQQGRTSEELRQLWDRDFWTETYASVNAWDERIKEFNARIAI
ncbi:MAG: cysteine synthase A [Candidatus Krumholzibacteriia bacterium]|jgi:cysteine synthase A